MVYSKRRLISIFLFCLVIILFLGLIVIPYFHELNHKINSDKYNIDSKIVLFKFSMNDVHFKVASANFLTKEDCQKFNLLPLEERHTILISGINSDSNASQILIVLSLIFIIISLFIKNEKLRVYLLMGSIVLLFVSLICFVFIEENLTYFKGSDIYYIFNNVSC